MELGLILVLRDAVFEVPGDTENAHFENALRVCFACESSQFLVFKASLTVVFSPSLRLWLLTLGLRSPLLMNGDSTNISCHRGGGR